MCAFIYYTPGASAVVAAVDLHGADDAGAKKENNDNDDNNNNNNK